MAADQVDPLAPVHAETETDLAQAFNDLSKGERTAAALENHLTTLERKLDEFLAGLDQDMPEFAAEAAMASESTCADAAGVTNGTKGEQKTEDETSK